LPDYLAEMFALVREEPKNETQITERAMIKELKLLLGYCNLASVKASLEITGYQHLDLLPHELMAKSNLPKIQRFLGTLNR